MSRLPPPQPERGDAGLRERGFEFGFFFAYDPGDEVYDNATLMRGVMARARELTKLPPLAERNPLVRGEEVELRFLRVVRTPKQRKFGQIMILWNTVAMDA